MRCWPSHFPTPSGFNVLPNAIVARIDGILSAAHRFAGQIPEDRLDDLLPRRPRSYRQLAYHVTSSK